MKKKMLCVDEYTHAQFKAVAKKERRKLYDMITIILNYYLENKEKEDR